jgi:ankyrin repeat protein
MLVTQFAVHFNEVLAINLYIYAGFDVEAPLLDGDTLLLIAARMNASNCVKWLMEAGAVFNPDLAPSGTALIAAAAHDALRSVIIIPAQRNKAPQY